MSKTVVLVLCLIGIGIFIGQLTHTPDETVADCQTRLMKEYCHYVTLDELGLGHRLVCAPVPEEEYCQ